MRIGASRSPATRRVAALVLAAGLALATTSCSDGVAVNLGDVNLTRLPDGRVQVDLELRGSEQGGGSVGEYCVSAYWFAVGLNLQLVPVTIGYYGPQDSVIQCASRQPGTPLRDGGTKAFRLVSARFDLPPGSPVRIQVSAGDNLDKEDDITP